MQDIELTIAGMGEEPPLIADGRAGPPDRREISARWLSGTFLTGLTSSVLMGVALFAALDGREQLATPPEIARQIAVALECLFENRQHRVGEAKGDERFGGVQANVRGGMGERIKERFQGAPLELAGPPRRRIRGPIFDVLIHARLRRFSWAIVAASSETSTE